MVHMFKRMVLISLMSVGLAACENPDHDRAHLESLIRTAIHDGVITQGRWWKSSHENFRVVRVTVSSVFPSEARKAAEQMCVRARALPLRDIVRVEVGLLAGQNSRPAGACYTRVNN